METNERGNKVVRQFRPGDRYRYDFRECKSSEGWHQYDTQQDAHYFGVWVHVEKWQILTYCEGDETLVTCPDQAHFDAEILAMNDFYGPPNWAWTTIDREGKVTRHYDGSALFGREIPEVPS